MRISTWITYHLIWLNCRQTNQTKQTLLLKRNEESGLYISIHFPGEACPFVLLVLTSQLEDLHVALLASLMDVIGMRYSQSTLCNALSWADGLNRLHCHPRGEHLLSLLGQNVEDAGQDTAKVSSQIGPSIHLYLSWFIHIIYSIQPFFYPAIHPFTLWFLCLSIHLFLCPSNHPSISLSVYPFIHLSMHTSIL